MVVMVLVEMVVADIVAVAVAVGVAVVGVVVVVVSCHHGMRVCVVDVDGCVALLGNIYEYCI